MSWVLVTGGTARGGEAIVRALHSAGLDVVIHHSPRSSARAASLRAELDERKRGSVRTWEADLSQAVEMPAWITELAPEYCVCNASVYLHSELGDSQRQADDMAVHLTAHASILKVLEPSLCSVVAVSDIHVDRPATGYLWYTVAKAALQSLIVTLAMEWAPRVRCNVVAPGALPLPETWTDEGRADAIKRSIPLGNLGRFEDLASAVKWMLLDAHYVTGQVLAIDGGRSRWLRD
ncbi:SDR family oxidoreductase [Variovorax sp. J22R133]|uniref:SDR family oxidoreductase n=1 Tax=Variovorax brevis TaxID=3053503 RepID=UPI0025763D03|nr:SDR family oxidoreductase [Variovorax sp. J22R133]MDM0116776.1 SDR family oxidoreductase [Variovorax sp. J22R133]